MLNLSDKDLDRLSQEAAQQHEPGDVVGPKFWDKLEARLDRDLGKVNPNPARGVRRLPYYYAPAVLVLLGVTYYLVRLNGKSQKGISSGSPPLTALRPAPAGDLKPASSPQNPVPSSKNSTPTEPSNTVQYPSTADAPAGTSAASARPGSNVPAASARPHASVPASSPEDNPASAHSEPKAAATAPPNAITASRDASTASASRDASTTSASRDASTNSASHPPSPASTDAPTTNTSANTSTNSASHLASPASHDASIAARPGASKPSNLHHHRNHLTGSNPNNTTNLTSSIGSAAATDDSAIASPGTRSSTSTSSDAPNRNGTSTAPGAPAATARDLTFSAVRGPARLATRGSIDDSALRAFNLATIRQPIHKDGLRINRSLEIGIVAGPDYTSVNSLAGDRPGSTIGITVDYQFANHLYLGTGLLFTKKVFAAAPQDYKVPSNYYYMNGIGGGSGVDYIKGTFSMLEIPLNLRYDFSTAGNPTFFASVGTSSYLFTQQDCGYYFDVYNRRGLYSKQINYTNYPDNLFATLNLSMGAEFGISNSLSAVLSPYIKIPTRGIGFGQVQLSSVGIDFALRFAPVLSRKR